MEFLKALEGGLQAARSVKCFHKANKRRHRQGGPRGHVRLDSRHGCAQLGTHNGLDGHKVN